MKALVAFAIAATGCMRAGNAPILVRDAYIAKGALVLEKCEVTSADKEIYVGHCFLERRALPRVVDRAPSTPPPPAPPPVVVPPPQAPPADEEREVAEPTPPQPTTSATSTSAAAAQTAPTPAPRARTGFGRVRDELASCATSHRVTGVVRVSLDIRANAVAFARAGTPNAGFERCVATNLVGIELPDTQPNRLLTVPFAVGVR
jgi:hypothetical protein